MPKDAIENMTDLDIHNELAELTGGPTFEQEVDRMMKRRPDVYPNRLVCERAYKRRLAENRARQKWALQLLRAEE
jgi:hypothetical protein